MSDKAHFEVSKSLVYKTLGILIAAIISLGLYIYQGDEQATRVALKTNQQAIQKTLDGMAANGKQIAVGKERMDGHIVNPVAHDN